MMHSRPTYWPKLEPSKPLNKMSAMLRHLNQHCETKLQRLVFLIQPLPSYQHTADRRACHRLTKRNTRINAHPNYKAKLNRQICEGCGSHLHGTPRTGSRQLKCPAWGQACSNCERPNHQSRVCWAKKVAQVVRKDLEANKAAMDTLMAHIIFNQTMGTYTAKDTSQIMEIEPYVVPFSPKPDPRQARDIPRNHSTKMVIFPDSGATICLRGLKHLRNRRLSTNNHIPSRKVVQSVGGFTLMCQGWLPVEFNVHGKTIKQALYICKKIQRLYFSRAACIDIGILPKDFPNPVVTMSP